MFPFLILKNISFSSFIDCRSISISTSVSQWDPLGWRHAHAASGQHNASLFLFLTSTQCSCCSKSFGCVLLSISRFSVSYPKGNPRHLDRSLRSSLRQSTCENACPQPTHPFLVAASFYWFWIKPRSLNSLSAPICEILRVSTSLNPLWKNSGSPNPCYLWNLREKMLVIQKFKKMMQN